MGAVTSGTSGFVINGTAAAATLQGSAFDDSITGGAAVDSLIGNSGADTIVSGGGLDVIKGGAGNDSIVLANSAVGASVIDGGTGTNTIDISAETGANSFATSTTTNIQTIKGISNTLGATLDVSDVGGLTTVAFASGTGTDTILTGLDKQATRTVDLSAQSDTVWEASAEANTGAVDAAGEWFMHATSGVLTYYGKTNTAVSSVTLTNVLVAEISTTGSSTNFTVLTA
jgi:hypothetical protein